MPLPPAMVVMIPAVLTRRKALLRRSAIKRDPVSVWLGAGAALDSTALTETVLAGAHEPLPLLS